MLYLDAQPLRPRQYRSHMRLASLLSIIGQIHLLFNAETVHGLSQVVLTSSNQSQQPLSINTDETSNLVFTSVASLLQQWANTRYRNGHTIVKGAIPVGVVMYHGGPINKIPTGPEWLATNFEHSFLFCFSGCWMLSLEVQEPLNVVYFDGSSASNSVRGHLDTQDLVIYGEVRRDKMMAEWERISLLCEWGKEFGIDAIVRMEMGFEIMLCDFQSKKVKIVSMDHLMRPERPNRGPRGPRNSSDILQDMDPLDILKHRSHVRQQHCITNSTCLGDPSAPPGGPPWKWPRPEPDPIPPNWSGSLREYISLDLQIVQASAWNNDFPGEVRVQLDYTRLLTFYDPAFESLVEARRGVDRSNHRLTNISREDFDYAMTSLRQDLVRPVEEKGSGVDWGSFTRVITDRYAERIELLRTTLNTTDFSKENATSVASRARRDVFIMLSPYILYGVLPDISNSTDSAWVEPITTKCYTTLTSSVDESTLLRSEVTIRNAIEGVLKRICTSLTDIWVDAMSVESATIERATELLGLWKTKVDELVEWLDWPMWDRCRPACPDDAFCYVNTWPWGVSWNDDGPIDMTPRCENRYNGYLGGGRP